MKFSEKLKALRKEHRLTQEELAERLYVTRTAVSKWETDKGFPGIDSLKLLSDQFDVSIDDLISEKDVETQRALDDRRARRMYWIAMAFLAGATLAAVLAAAMQLRPLAFVSVGLSAGYVLFAMQVRSYRRRTSVKRILLPLILSRVLLAGIFAGVLAVLIWQMS